MIRERGVRPSRTARAERAVPGHTRGFKGKASGHSTGCALRLSQRFRLARYSCAFYGRAWISFQHIQDHVSLLRPESVFTPTGIVTHIIQTCRPMGSEATLSALAEPTALAPAAERRLALSFTGGKASCMPESTYIQFPSLVVTS
jgi:hypothetical protein